MSKNKFGSSKFAELRPKEIEFENSFVCIFAKVLSNISRVSSSKEKRSNVYHQ